MAVTLAAELEAARAMLARVQCVANPLMYSAPVVGALGVEGLKCGIDQEEVDAMAKEEYAACLLFSTSVLPATSSPFLASGTPR